jgi:hypothetical protein
VGRPVCLQPIVCVGKDCRRERGFEDLIASLADARCAAQQVACQDLCHGPIVGLRRGDKVRWYSGVRTKKLRAAVVSSVVRDDTSKRLAGHEVKTARHELRRRRTLRPLRA